MSNEPKISTEDLHAFIDGELDPERAARVEKAIAENPSLAQQVKAFRSDRDRLARLHEQLLEQPLPREWLAMVAGKSGAFRIAGLAVSRRAVAALAAGLVLVIGSWLAYDRLVPREDPILAEAFAAREERMRPAETHAVSALAAPGQSNRVLTEALGMPLKAPDLTRMGYGLTAIRIYTDVPGGRAIELDYRNAQNRRFTLYLRRPLGPERVELIRRDGMRICVWQDDVLGTVMMGEMSAGEMARIASLAYSGLTL